MHSHRRPVSGPHSVGDARQYALSLLVFGPAAPAPEPRSHRGQLPDHGAPVPQPARRSWFTRLAALLVRPSAPDTTMSGGGGDNASSVERHLPSPAPERKRAA